MGGSRWRDVTRNSNSSLRPLVNSAVRLVSYSELSSVPIKIKQALYNIEERTSGRPGQLITSKCHILAASHDLPSLSAIVVVKAMETAAWTLVTVLAGVQPIRCLKEYSSSGKQEPIFVTSNVYDRHNTEASFK